MQDIKFTGSIVGKRPIISVFFDVPAYKKSKMIDFLIDSGSVFSALSEKEATLMGIDCFLLPDSKRKAVGFGGLFIPKIINRLVILTFKSNKEEHKIRYSSGFRVTCIPPNTTSEEREKLLRYTPSVLGMDILCKFKMYMSKNKVELTLNS